MKNLNFLTDLRNSDQVMTRLRPGNNQVKTTLRFVAILTMLLTFGIGNAWGAPVTVTYAQTSTSAASISSGTAPANSTVSFSNSYGTKEQLSNGNSMVLTLSGYKGYKITAIKLSMHSNSKQGSGTFSAVAGTTTLASISSNTKFNAWYDNTSYGTSYRDVNVTMTNSTYEIKKDEDVVITITCPSGKSNNSLYCQSFTITYEAAGGGCSTQVNITNSSTTSVTHGSFDVDKTGSQDACSALSVTVTPNPDDHYHVASVSATDPATTGTAGDAVDNGDGTYTITYSANAKGNSTISVTFAEDTKYTVTWMKNGSQHTTTQVYSGEKPTFPSNPSSCDATSTTFYGWATAEWPGKLDDVSAKTIYTSASSMPAVSSAVTYYAVFCKGSAGTEVLNEEFDNSSSSDSNTKIGTSTFTNFSGSTDYAYPSQYGGLKLGSGSYVGYITSKSLDLSSAFTVSIDIRKYGTDDANISVTVGSTTKTISNSSFGTSGYETCTLDFDAATSTSTVYITTEYVSSKYRAYIDNVVVTRKGAQSKFLTNCCTDPGLAYGTASVTKTYGADAFTNTLTNSHSVAVTYSSSDETVATVNGSGQVTILKAGSTTITASSAAQTVAAVSYCADEASYTLTVNKASISPTLTYDPAAVTVGSTLTSFTLSGNSGSGSVSYSSSNDAIATVNSSGVVTGVAPGTVTITATIAATTNYNGNTATSNTITVNAAACTGVNSLHTGNKDQGGWVTNQCFEDADWGAADDAIYVGAFPLTNECYVGWAGGNSYYGAYWAVGGIKTYDIPTGRTLGWNSGNYYQDYPGGALGTFHIYKNSTDENYYLRFKPSSYILRTGSDGTSWTSREMTVSATNSHYYETAELDLTSTLISEHAYVDLKTNGGDGHVWCNFSNDRTASGNVKVKSSVGDADGNFRGDNLKASDNGTHGKFRIDITKDVDNWKLAFVPMYRITYAAGTGASGSMDPSSYAEISTNIAAAANDFTAPTGKQFNGWSDGVNSYSAGDNVTMNSDVTLTAQWTDINYTVTVNQNPSVGATTTGQTTTAHYNGTINLTTTVPSGYRFVNWTTSDGFSITNSTSATTASFTMPNKNVTVTANFQQTHTVDWYVGGSAPANKIGDDGQTTVVDHGGKISDFPATTPDGSACDKVFVGWTNTSSYVHGTSLLFNDVAGSPTINANASFYAVFATESSGGDPYYQKVTSTGDISNDGRYLIVYETDGVVFNGGLGTIDAGNNVISATFSEGAIEITDGNRSDLANAEFSIDMTNLYIKNKDNKYIYQDSYGNGLPNTTDPHDLHSISIDGNGDFIVEGKGQNSNSPFDYAVLRFNSATGAGNYRFRFYKNSQQKIQLYKYIGGTTYTGHTINCADCGTSVTVSYSAPGSGNTMAVTKNAAAVASGSTVKTCTSQDLTVILTPATHYDLTGFTATGLTTGTATITPAVGSTLPVSVAQTFTVTVSAGATGTLTLAPTFTAQTPLSITLETHSKGTFTPIGDIYSGESFTFPTVTPSDAECSSFLGWIEGTTWSGDGTETDPTAITGLANYHAAGSSSGTLTTTKTYTAVFGEKDTQVIPAYQKVTSAPSNWSGDYLIVRDDNSRAFDGSLSTLDAADNYIGVTISDGSITANSTVNASKWTIAKVGETSNYTIKSASGYYIGRTANSNGLNSSTSEEYTNTLAYSTDHVDITSSAGPKLQMNGGTRFRYYGTSQQVLQLYKYNPDAEVVAYTYCTNPACTPRYRVTMNSATGGSPSADKVYEHADETITLTANPSSGYSFTSWTITKTTGGDNVTSTLLTGDKPTTANTTFTMPAYDITIAATYTKKMVSTLEVKDGATVVSTTTGPVSGTVNISTGANKTLDVVITPSDAYDHSWTATVSAGSTYASITNVTDDGFRVNGLAQGDATITVNAPNDGSAKSVTFTVHVTDIMPEEIILKRDGSETPINALTIYLDQYAKINVSYSPTPTDKAFTFSSADATSVSSRAHAPASGYETLHGLKVTSSPVNCTFTSATGSVTKVLAVTVLALPADQFIDYIHGNATVTRAAQVSADHWSINTSITTPTLSDAAESASADCEEGHYHLIGWLPQATAESLWAAGTPITSATEGLVAAGAEIEASGITWYAIWAKKE